MTYFLGHSIISQLMQGFKTRLNLPTYIPSQVTLEMLNSEAVCIEK